MRAFSKLNIFGYFIVEFVAVSLGDGVVVKYISTFFLLMITFKYKAKKYKRTTNNQFD